MDEPEIDTTLVDLQNTSLDQVINGLEAIRGDVEVLLRQIERPRFNIGSVSSPGRAD